jgi:GNAT superfamily N-acetyltransferase
MTDGELSARLRTNLLSFKLLQAREGLLSTLTLPGVHAFALPSRPDNLFQQQVIYEERQALAEALQPLAAWYREQGVPAWRVPAFPGDEATAALLARFGHRPEDPLPAMGLMLEGALPPRLPLGVSLVHPEGLQELVELNALSYGVADAAFLSPWAKSSLPNERVHVVVVRAGGQALACGLSLEEEGTAGIYLVATHPAARRQGLASVVMRGLHADARARGCTAAVLQASIMGHPLYQHLGYRDLGLWINWVYRSG